jgi:pyrroloquinoline quinone biosynthesis protein D
MSTPPPFDPAARPALERRFRLQWEAAQDAHVLLYPEGMIKLNASAGEILKRCDGRASIAEITADLECTFATTGLGADVMAFLALAADKRWVSVAS